MIPVRASTRRTTWFPISAMKTLPAPCCARDPVGPTTGEGVNQVRIGLDIGSQLYLRGPVVEGPYGSHGDCNQQDDPEARSGSGSGYFHHEPRRSHRTGSRRPHLRPGARCPELTVILPRDSGRKHSFSATAWVVDVSLRKDRARPRPSSDPGASGRRVRRRIRGE